jgi:hypothetical protein
VSRPVAHGDLRYLRAVTSPPHLVRGRTLARHLGRNASIVGGLIAVALAIGATGYHYLDDLPWLDAALNAAMILTGMGPVSPLVHPGAKLFAIAYALVSGVFFLTMVALLLAPALHHFLHRFHLELDARRSREPPPHRPPVPPP